MSSGLKLGVFFFEWHIVGMSLDECNHMKSAGPKGIDCLWEGRLVDAWCESVKVSLIIEGLLVLSYVKKGVLKN